MARDAGAWFRQPVLWLGAITLAASLFACVVTIALALRHADPPVEAAKGGAMKVPLQRSAAAQSASEAR